MTIPLKHEGDIAKHFWGIIEKCHFCKEHTKYWHENTNNPVCPKCSKLHKVVELPDHGKLIRKRKQKRY